MITSQKLQFLITEPGSSEDATSIMNIQIGIENVIKRGGTVSLIDADGGALVLTNPMMKIQQIVGSHFAVTIDDLLMKKKTEPLATIRGIAMALSYDYADKLTGMTGVSSNTVGEVFQRGHDTVLYHFSKLRFWEKDDRRYKEHIRELREKIEESFRYVKNEKMDRRRSDKLKGGKVAARRDQPTVVVADDTEDYKQCPGQKRPDQPEEQDDLRGGATEQHGAGMVGYPEDSSSPVAGDSLP